MNHQFERVFECLDVVRTLEERRWIIRCPCKLNHKNGDQSPSASLAIKETGNLLFKCHKGCTWEEAVAATTGNKADWFSTEHELPKAGKHREKKVYTYKDADGKFLYEIVRLSDPKGFFARRYDDETGFPVHGLKAGYYQFYNNWCYRFSGNTASGKFFPEVPKTLYRLPELVNTPDSSTIHIVEGEKKVDLIFEIGGVATANSCGAGKFTLEMGKHLRNKKVLIWPDNDDVGYEHAASVAGIAILGGALAVTIVDWRQSTEKFPVGFDIADIKGDTSIVRTLLNTYCSTLGVAVKKVAK